MVVADAPLVAAHAQDALVLAPLADAARQVRIGDQRARHAYGVGRARGHQRLGLGGLVMREVAISGTPSAGAEGLPGSRIASRATGGGGTIQAAPR